MEAKKYVSIFRQIDQPLRYIVRKWHNHSQIKQHQLFYQNVYPETQINENWSHTDAELGYTLPNEGTLTLLFRGEMY